jgi:nucleotide-binding universal stress UspA family protein
MFSKILYPTDFSKKSEHALRVVKKLKEAGTKIIVLVHCIDTREVNTMADMEGFSSIHFADIVEEIRTSMKKKAVNNLAKINNDLTDYGFKIEERLTEGIPFKEIIRLAKKEAVDAIVIGSTGKGLISEMLLGSTSEKVIREAEIPVILVK